MKRASTPITEGEQLETGEGRKQAETPLIEGEQLETDEGGHTLTSLTEGN